MNIFLRCDDDGLKQALNLKNYSDQEIFSKLRDLKDTFNLYNLDLINLKAILRGN